LLQFLTRFAGVTGLIQVNDNPEEPACNDAREGTDLARPQIPSARSMSV
jgi:hypothetical protein